MRTAVASCEAVAHQPVTSPLDSPRVLWSAAACVLAIQFALSFEVAMIVVELALLAWIARHPQDQSAGRLMAFCFFQMPVWLLIYFGWTNWLDAANPLKYDPLLLAVDRRLGFDGFAFARLIRPLQPVLKLPYEGLRVFLVLWFGLHFRARTHARFLTALVAVFGIGAGLYYWILPACGPMYAFRGFPTGAPEITASVQMLSGIPNCIPSLHLATAMLFVLFPVGDRGTRLFAWAFLAGTAMATLLGQHYLVDLVLAVPFGMACAALAWRQWIYAAVGFVLTAAPMVTLRLTA